MGQDWTETVGQDGVGINNLSTNSAYQGSEPAEVARIGGAQADASALGGPLKVAGRVLAYGLGAFGGSRLEVLNRGEYARLLVDVGVDEASQNRRSQVRFQIYGDGRLLAQSGPMGSADSTSRMDANVQGVQVIELIASGRHARSWRACGPMPFAIRCSFVAVRCTRRID